MVAMVMDEALERRLIARRRATGADRYDEVWDGIYVMSPLADIEHQDLASGIVTVLRTTVQWPGLGRVFGGVNISDRQRGWRKNFRCPDVAVFLNGSRAVQCKAHWHGGPDFAVEVVSPRDRSLKKLPFYEQIGTRELLLVDRKPWSLTLYRLGNGALAEVGRSTLDDRRTLASEVIPVSWRLTTDEDRTGIEILHLDGDQRWVVGAHGH
jgi:Uma2 family endonuclease